MTERKSHQFSGWALDKSGFSWKGPFGVIYKIVLLSAMNLAENSKRLHG